MESKTMESKVITKSVTFGNHKEQYVLVQVTTDKGVAYGTIPYSAFDEKGVLKRKVCGWEMGLNLSIKSALETRQDMINCEGMTEEQIFAYFKRKIEQAKGKA